MAPVTEVPVLIPLSGGIGDEEPDLVVVEPGVEETGGEATDSVDSDKPDAIAAEFGGLLTFESGVPPSEAPVPVGEAGEQPPSATPSAHGDRLLEAVAEASEEEAKRTTVLDPAPAASPDLPPSAGEPALYALGGIGAAAPRAATADGPQEGFAPLDRGGIDRSAAEVVARLRRNAKKSSLAGELVKIVLGGMAGLAIGYYALNYFGGTRFDGLRIYLPGCPHTYENWPLGGNPPPWEVSRNRAPGLRWLDENGRDAYEA